VSLVFNLFMHTLLFPL